MSDITLYGIKNCDTVRAARKWLDAQGIAHRFHDVREDGLDTALVQSWFDGLGWDKVVNKRSTTWKQLDAEQRDSIDASSALQLIIDNPTLAKRPVLNTGSELHLGFKPAQYAEIF